MYTIIKNKEKIVKKNSSNNKIKIVYKPVV